MIKTYSITSCAPSNYCFQQSHDCTPYICMVYSHCVYVNVNPRHLNKKTIKISRNHDSMSFSFVLPCVLNAFGQVSHLNGRSPVCIWKTNEVSIILRSSLCLNSKTLCFKIIFLVFHLPGYVLTTMKGK